jgi:uncharacterized protein YdhG (YjbR/CyaY superfamily)
MDSKQPGHAGVDDYIASFPADVQTALQEVRAAIREAAPDAQECISYGIAGYFSDGVLIYFAGYRQHIGLYPAPREAEFAEAFALYGSGKATLRFPLAQPMPLELVTRIVKWRLARNAQGAAKTRRSKGTPPA